LRYVSDIVQRGRATLIKFRDRMARGRTRTGWLDSRHSFSFAGYHDPDHMGFRALRVINEDRVIPGAGFPSHSHRDMEIVSYVLEGRLMHKDSLGNGSLISPGEVQRMSAGSGITHNEYNASADAPVHFLQIWILPERTGAPPGYAQKPFALDAARGKLLLAAGPEGAGAAVGIDGDALIYAGSSIRAPPYRMGCGLAAAPGCRSLAVSWRSTIPRCARATAPRSKGIRG
jgi:redox-sensitive bicupin YhaK (pirin superfamily)